MKWWLCIWWGTSHCACIIYNINTFSMIKFWSAGFCIISLTKKIINLKLVSLLDVVHSDLKPANFLFVGASLKLIDFGIASSIPSNKTSVMKDVLIGTINYMSPEAICGCYSQEDGQQVYKIPLKSDVWSLGCILYAMVYGRTPFQHLPNQIAKTQAISSPNYRIEFQPIKDQLLLDVLKVSLYGWTYLCYVLFYKRCAQDFRMNKFYSVNLGHRAMRRIWLP